MRRPGQPVVGYIAEFVLLRRIPESEMQLGEGPPIASAPAPRMHGAALSSQEKSLALASAQNSRAFPAAATAIRSIFGACGGTARQESLVAEDVDES